MLNPYTKLICNHSWESCICAVYMVEATMKYQLYFLTYTDIQCLVLQSLGRDFSSSQLTQHLMTYLTGKCVGRRIDLQLWDTFSTNTLKTLQKPCYQISIYHWMKRFTPSVIKSAFDNTIQTNLAKYGMLYIPKVTEGWGGESTSPSSQASPKTQQEQG